MALSIAKHPLRKPLFQDMTEELIFLFFFSPRDFPKEKQRVNAPASALIFCWARHFLEKLKGAGSCCDSGWGRCPGGQCPARAVPCCSLPLAQAPEPLRVLRSVLREASAGGTRHLITTLNSHTRLSKQHQLRRKAV